MAAVFIQKIYRGWHVRHVLRTLRKQAVLEHGRTWVKLVADYRELVAKIRSRYGVTRKSCPIDLQQISDFMDRKIRYEKVFLQVAPHGKLHRESLMEFFNLCDLWPTQRDINRCFDVIFRGSRNTGEVVFLLDCSSSIGLVGFHKLSQLLRALVLSLDVAPDRTRVGVVPYSEAVFNDFRLDMFHSKNDVLAAISLVKLRQGLTRTDLALKHARDMFKDSRPGVQKLAILITDGKSTYPDKTTEEGKMLHNIGVQVFTIDKSLKTHIELYQVSATVLITPRTFILITDGKSTYPDKTTEEGKILHKIGVQVFTIGVGDRADTEELELLASSTNNCYKALDAKSLTAVRKQIEKRLCLAACGFCQYLLPRIQKAGMNVYEVMDLVWTLFPPTAAGIKHTHILRKLPLATSSPEETITAPGTDHAVGVFDQSEALDVVWTLYPPEVCEVQSVTSKSRWIRPIVDGTEAWSLLDDDMMRATGMRACLRLVVQARLEREGFVTVPSSVREGVERATTETQVMQALDKYILGQGSIVG